MSEKKIYPETTVTLPSRGIIYPDKKIPADVSIRGMTTREEKVLYSSTGGDVFSKILKSCITTPEDFDTSGLIAADEMFLIIQLRIVTFGPEYRVQTTCPHCGKTDVYTINLSDFDIDYLPEDFKEPIDVKLPVSGDTLSLRILRNSDNEMLDKFIKKRSKQFNLPLKEVEYDCRNAKYITAVNGEPIDFVDAIDYFQNMMSMDSMRMQTALSEVKVGVDTTATALCTSCREEFEFQTPITREFFRPTIK
jgi:hypothetical protein